MIKNIIKNLNEQPNVSWMCEEEIKELQKYADIEDKLGVDLITLFKALKNGFWVRYERSNPNTQFGKYAYEYVNPKDDGDIHNEVSLDIYHLCIYDWDNYMKSRCGARRFKYDLKGTYKAKEGFAWALTEEELC